MKKILKVGFDLDGVILYNPIRVFRGPARKFLKPLKVFLLHQKKENFYFPRSSAEKFLWRIIHKTSFKVNNGYDELKTLSKNKKIELYLITGRYNFLADDFSEWVEKISAKKIFTRCILNDRNMQPNQFKEAMIKKLGLDVYVEDNWDIIEKLNHHTKAKILWLSNLFDSHIPYQLKFYSLQEVCRYLKSLV